MKRFYRLNQNIKAEKVRVIDSSSKQVGIMSIGEARQKAGVLGLDLVEIAPKASPPVVKLIDFKKFKYEEEKKEREIRKKTKETGTKEIWLGPLISDHDLETRVGHAKDFFKKGDRVKFSVRFSGREMAHPELGHRILERVSEMLKEYAESDTDRKFLGRNLIQGFKPKKQGEKENEG